MHHSAQRRKEGAQINASLMALKECVRARASGKNRSHVYRKSKLTMALKGSFVLPTARTMIIATVSPSSKDTEHSLNTFRHACIMDLKEGGGARRKRTAQERSKDKYEITYNTKGQPTKTLKKTTASNSSEESVHRVYGSTVVDISIPPPSFKPIALPLSRSPLSKTPKQVFINPINIFEHLLHNSVLLFSILLFSFNVDYLTSEEYEQGLQSLAEANARLRDQLISLQKETKEKDITSKEMTEAMNQTYATANQEIKNLQTGK